MEKLFSWGIAFIACLIGKICGMGGGVIIKPVLDAAGQMNAKAINFYSSCTVLAMAAWSVARSLYKKESAINLKASSALGYGAIAGGLLGKVLFNRISQSMGAGGTVTVIQNCVLVIACLLTLVYTLRKEKIRSFHVKSWIVSFALGIILGALGVFLGIGGGPFNMALLFLFWSMDTKTAAINSLFIILFSQTSSVVQTMVLRQVPAFSGMILAGMILFGIIGSEAGSRINHRLSEKHVSALFVCSIVLVISICILNIIRYA